MSDDILDKVKVHIASSDVPLTPPDACLITTGYRSYILDPTGVKFKPYLRIVRDDLRTRVLLAVYDNPVVICDTTEGDVPDAGTQTRPSSGFLILPSAIVPVPGASLESTGALISAPTAGTVLASVAAPAGVYQVPWQTHNNVAVGLSDNYGLYVNGVLVATSENGTPAGITNQDPVTVVVPVAGTITVEAIATDTGTYQADLTATPEGAQPAVESPTGMSPIELYGNNELYIYAVAGFGNARISIMRERKAE